MEVKEFLKNLFNDPDYEVSLEEYFKGITSSEVSEEEISNSLTLHNEVLEIIKQQYESEKEKVIFEEDEDDWIV